MSIVGCVVYNKRYGKGYITKCDNNIVTVKFSDNNLGDFQANFIFPSAFTDGFLTFSDKRVTEYIDQMTIEQTCSSCGRKSAQTKLIDGRRFCETCEKQKISCCIFCGELHERRNFTQIHTKISPLPSVVSMCQDCIPIHSFRCSECGTQYTTENKMLCLDEKNLCISCYRELVQECDFCGVPHLRKECKYFYYDGDSILVCPECKTQHTFTCSRCGHEELTELLVESKYVSASQKLCRDCVTACSACGEAIERENIVNSFNENYCIECWESKKRTCPICSEEFIPKIDSQSVCFDCDSSIMYISRLKSIDFTSRKAKVLSVYDLDTVNRCELFTNLYENCRSLETGKAMRNDAKPFHYIVMHFFCFDAVIAYIPSSITNFVRYSENVTMTELRSGRGKRKVNDAILYWLPKSNYKITLSEGDMTVLNYPVLLRVQTKYDKNYGKEWNGPGDYIEIGNYGDTTEFYFIGVLDKE